MPSRKVAIFGHGTIGGGVSRILLAEQQKIAAKSGITLELAAICTKDAELDPEIYTTYRSLFRDASEVLADPEIDIICETIGGDGIALQFVKTALQNGKHVVTANKKMIALHFAELSALAREHNATLRYEAAVGGGIPLLSTVSDGLVADDITFVEASLMALPILSSARWQARVQNSPRCLKKRKTWATPRPTPPMMWRDSTSLTNSPFSARLPLAARCTRMPFRARALPR